MTERDQKILDEIRAMEEHMKRHARAIGLFDLEGANEYYARADVLLEVGLLLAKRFGP